MATTTTNYKNTIEGRKFLNKVFYTKSLTYGKFINDLNFNDVIPLIKCIDQDCEDWEITEKLFQYFASEIYDLLNEIENLDDVNNDTINIINKLNEILKKTE